ncbi:MAG: CHRD domain-containing protein [Steroidobacteraceae bacterium]|nr:CHRD domain-containing protein [Deltaproteobacteria bacterium]
MQVHFNKTVLRTTLALTLSCSLALLTAACGGGDGGGGTPAPTPTPTPAPVTVTRQATLTTGQELPAPTLPDAAAAAPGGTASFTLYSTNKLRGSMTLTGFVSPATAPNDVTAAHIHDGDVGVSGAPVVPLAPDAAKVVWSAPANTVLTDAQVAKFKAGGYYVNAHTATNTAGLIRGQLISFTDNVQSIFTANCIECHSSAGAASEIMSLVAGSAHANLVNQAAVSPLVPVVPGGSIRVIPGNSAASVLFKKISGTTAGPQMPFLGSILSANNQNLIKVWIDMGAKNN